MQGTLTPALLCCPSGNVDGCGVCDGDGTQCATRIAAAVTAPTSVLSSGSTENAAFLSAWRTNTCAALRIPADRCSSGVSVQISAAMPGRRRLQQLALQVRFWLLPFVSSALVPLDSRLLPPHCRLSQRWKRKQSLRWPCLLRPPPRQCWVSRPLPQVELQSPFRLLAQQRRWPDAVMARAHHPRRRLQQKICQMRAR